MNPVFLIVDEYQVIAGALDKNKEQHYQRK